jgi:hypothetical protein
MVTGVLNGSRAASSSAQAPGITSITRILNSTGAAASGEALNPSVVVEASVAAMSVPSAMIVASVTAAERWVTVAVVFGMVVAVASTKAVVVHSVVAARRSTAEAAVGSAAVVVGLTAVEAAGPTVVVMEDAVKQRQIRVELVR